MKTALIVDGICPRGLSIIRYLSSTGEYHILVFTKDTTSAGATTANSLPGVTLLLNRAHSGYDLSTFVAAAQRCPSVLVCSSTANSEGREGVQWGARLVHSSTSAGVKHLVFLAMDRERKQYSTDNYIYTQNKAPMSWTIIRSPVEASQSYSSATSERTLSAGQLRNLAYYVTWVFSNGDRSTGLDFVLPAAEPSGVTTDSKRRDSRIETTSPTRPVYQIEGVQPHPDIGSIPTPNRPSASRTTPVRNPSTSSNKVGSAYTDSGRAKAIQQWMAQTSPDRRGKNDENESSHEEDESSGSETA